MQRDALFQHATQPRGRLFERFTARLVGGRLPKLPAINRLARRIPLQPSRLEHSHAGNNRPRLQDEPARQEVGQSFRIDAPRDDSARQQSAHFRGECHGLRIVVRHGDIERLDSQRTANERQHRQARRATCRANRKSAIANMPRNRSTNSSWFSKVKLKDDFRIGASVEGDARPAQPLALGAEIVNLAVEQHGHPAIGRPNRLHSARRQIDQRQPNHSGGAPVECERAAAVRPAMLHRVQHRRHGRLGIKAGPAVPNSGYSAHVKIRQLHVELAPANIAQQAMQVIRTARRLRSSTGETEDTGSQTGPGETPRENDHELLHDAEVFRPTTVAHSCYAPCSSVVARRASARRANRRRARSSRSSEMISPRRFRMKFAGLWHRLSSRTR